MTEKKPSKALDQNKPLLDVQDLKSYFRSSQGQVRAVDGVSFQIGKNETYAIVGESGCGKSVTAFSILGLLPKSSSYHPSGRILYNDIDLLAMSDFEIRKIRGNQISMIFQEPMTCLNPVYSVAYQLAEPLMLHEKLSKNEALDRSMQWLDQVKISDVKRVMNSYPHELSGGMRQRVMIAMAMSTSPDLLIADEPTTALDVTIQKQVLELMHELKEKNNTSILLITHDLGIVSEFADNMGVMYAGQIIETGRVENILRHPLHPYTSRLLQSLPTSAVANQPLQTIKGRVPPAYAYVLQGCRFYDRCHVKIDSCKTTTPDLTTIDAIDSNVSDCKSKVLCLLYENVAAEDVKKVKVDVLKTAIKLDSSKQNKSIASNEALINLKNFEVYFPVFKGLLKKVDHYVKAVDGIELTIYKGETLALVGESGSGKSTLAKALLRLIDEGKGELQYQDQLESTNLFKLNKKEWKPFRKKMQIIFQDPYSSLNPRLIVEDIILEGMKSLDVYRTKDEKIKKVDELLNRVGLDLSAKSRYPHEFSGGQRQRICIARALAVEPEFIICDEATSALDVSVQAQILNLLKEIQKKMGITFLFITHDLSVVRYLADRVVVMKSGKIVEMGLTNQIFEHAKNEYTKTLLAAVPVITKLD